MNPAPLIFSLLVVALAVPGWCAEKARVELSTAAAIRELSVEDATARPSVRIRGVVILPQPDRTRSIVIVDESVGLFCDFVHQSDVRLDLGDLVELSGHVEPGGYAPYLKVDFATVLGSGTVPPPKPVTYAQLATGRYDAQFIEITGTVRHISDDGAASQDCLVELATEGGRLTLRLPDFSQKGVSVDAEIRVSGVCFYQYSAAGMVIKPVVSVPLGTSPVVLRPPPREIPERPVKQLMSFADAEFFGHRVRVSGIVTCQLPDFGFWLRQDGVGLLVRQPRGTKLSLGDKVEVTGFPVSGDYSPELEDVLVRVLSNGPAPEPFDIGSPSDALEHDGELVRLDATLIEEIRNPLGLRLILRDGMVEFPAQLRMDSGSQVNPPWETGSLVRVSGICRVFRPSPESRPGAILPQDFELILRAPGDLAVLRPPPWWNAKRQARLLGWTSAALLLAVGFVMWRSRRSLRKSGAARLQSEAEFAAVHAERNRIAREIHDTLAQGLGAISLRLEVVKGKLPTGSEAASQLAEASALVQNSLRATKNSIWKMRSQALDHDGLPVTLGRFLDQQTEPLDIESTMIVSGIPSRLDDRIESNLLRVGQEAISNAVKHAKAKHIEVVLDFAQGVLSLVVHDDGCGFDIRNSPPEGLHFGLIGLRERGDEIGATIHIESSHGKGTRVTVNLPLPPEAGISHTDV